MKNDGKCMICGQKVEGWRDYGKLGPENYDQINGAVVGEYIPLRGHRRCLQNVNRFVVGLNRRRVNSLEFAQALLIHYGEKMEDLRKSRPRKGEENV